MSPELRKESECACETCKQMCQQAPCIATPLDVFKLIAEGYHGRLEIGFAHDKRHDVYWPCVVPQRTHEEGPCTFLTSAGLCELHAKCLKPTEGKMAIHDLPDNGLHLTVASTWASELGIKVIQALPNGDKVVRVLAVLKAAIEEARFKKTKDESANVHA